MSDGDWPDDRTRIAYEEARTVIDAQNETMADIDDKAMRSVRLTAVLIGLVIAAFQIDPGVFDELFLSIGFLLLVIAVFCGVATYDQSGLYLGPDGEFIEELGDEVEFEKSWDTELTETLSGMIAKNRISLKRNSWIFRATNGLLLLGISGIVLAVVI